jgi:hypothetical protein
MRRPATATRRLAAATLALLLAPVSAPADSFTREVSSITSGRGQAVAFRVTVDFTPTGGSFGAGTGTATVRFTLENISGVYPFQSPALGNPLLTGFFFNVPPGTGMTYREARILGGATLFSSGTNMNGVTIAAGCHVVAADSVVTDWYALDGQRATGQYGMLTNQLAAGKGNKPGLADPGLFVGCARQGYFFSPLVIAGRIRLTLDLDHLGTMMSSASGFLAQCSTAPGDHQAISLGAKFQATDTNGQGSAFVGEPCLYTAVERPSWGTLKSHYR